MSRQDVLLNWNGEEVKKRARSLIGKSTWTIGMAVLSDAKQLCAVDYGYLAASIMSASRDKKTELESPGQYSDKKAPVNHDTSSFKPIQSPGGDELTGEVFVGTAVDYGPYVEFGTFRMNAQPFLRPALDMAQGKILKIVEQDAKLEFGDYLNPRGKMTHAEARGDKLK